MAYDGKNMGIIGLQKERGKNLKGISVDIIFNQR